MKLLWFVDSRYFDENVETLTGLAYAHPPRGPSPHYHELLVDLLEEAGIVEVNCDLKEDDSEMIKIKLKDPSATRYLTPKEKAVIERIVRQFGSISTSELIKSSHEDPRWRIVFS